MSQLILLSTGQHTIVDDEDYNSLAQWRWTNTKRNYVQRVIYPNGKDKGITIFMHRVIMNTPKGMHTDHINGNPLDNRRSNLRICTPSNNLGNRKPGIRRACKTTYKGIFFLKEIQKWRAMICVDGKRTHLGVFVSELDAAVAYDNAARRYFGEFARLNFPDVAA